MVGAGRLLMITHFQGRVMADKFPLELPVIVTVNEKVAFKEDFLSI